jgi:hypothetical protein
MKHLKKFESHDEDIKVIKAILIDLKDKYPYVDGEIISEKNYIGISIKTEGVLKLKQDLDLFTVEYTKFKLQFLQSVIELVERISSALQRECKIIRIWDCGFPNYSNINIRVNI